MKSPISLPLHRNRRDTDNSRDSYFALERIEHCGTLREYASICRNPSSEPFVFRFGPILCSQ